MMKKKISIKHIPNKQLRPLVANDYEYYPYYIQIVYNRKNTKIKSVLFDKIFSLELRSVSSYKKNFLIAQEYFPFDIFSLDLVPLIDPENNLCRALQAYDAKIIRLTIEKLIKSNPDFILNSFQENSKDYLRDVIPFIEESIYIKLFEYVESREVINHYPLQGIKKLHNIGLPKFSMDLIEEIIEAKNHIIEDKYVYNLYEAYKTFLLILENRLHEAITEVKYPDLVNLDETGPGFESFYLPYIIFNDPSFYNSINRFFPEFKYLKELVSSLKIFPSE